MKTSSHSFPLITTGEVRHKQEESVSFQLLSAAFEFLPEGLFLFDNQRTLCFINRAGQQLHDPVHGWPVGRSCCEMFWGSGAGKGCLVDRAMQEGRLVEVEIQRHAPAGQTLVLLVVPVQESGNTPGAVVIARDITPLRRAQAAIFEQKAFRASLADRAPDEIYTLDLEGRITWMNARAETANISLPSGILNRHFSGMVVDAARDMFRQMIQRTLAGEDTNAEFCLIGRYVLGLVCVRSNRAKRLRRRSQHRLSTAVKRGLRHTARDDWPGPGKIRRWYPYRPACAVSSGGTYRGRRPPPCR